MRAGTDRDLSSAVQDYMSHWDRRPESNDEEEVEEEQHPINVMYGFDSATAVTTGTSSEPHSDIDEEVNEVCGISEELIDQAPTTTQEGPDFAAALREGIRAHERIESERQEGAIEEPTEDEIIGDIIGEEEGNTAEEFLQATVRHDLTGWDWYDGPNDEEEANDVEEEANDVEEETIVAYHGQSLWGTTLDELTEPYTVDPAEEEEEPEEN